MGEIVRQAILHALVASGVVEATLRVWGIRRAGTRLAFWLLALAFPFLVLPLFLVIAPNRSTDRFAAARALFASDRWSEVAVAGVDADALVFGLLGVAGTLLFLRDAVPFAIAAVQERRQDRAPHVPAPPALAALAADLAARVHVRVPDVAVLRTDAPIVLVHGVARHTFVLSEGVLARLSPEELAAATAHELAHARFRDPLAGWLLMAARFLMFWNPAVQLTARAIVQEMEHRADEVAAEVTGARTFAGALRRLAAVPTSPGLKPGTYDRADGRPGLMPGTYDRTDGRPELGPRTYVERLHRAHIEARIASVLAPRPGPARFVAARLALVGAALGVLVFFVV